jgi:hypothetical protein
MGHLGAAADQADGRAQGFDSGGGGPDRKTQGSPCQPSGTGKRETRGGRGGQVGMRNLGHGGSPSWPNLRRPVLKVLGPDLINPEKQMMIA